MSYNFIDITTNDFRKNFSAYVRLLEQDPNSGIIIRRYNKPVGLFIPMSDQAEAYVPDAPENTENLKNQGKCESSFDLLSLFKGLG